LDGRREIPKQEVSNATLDLPQDEQMTLESFAVGALEERQMAVQRNGRPK